MLTMTRKSFLTALCLVIISSIILVSSGPVLAEVLPIEMITRYEAMVPASVTVSLMYTQYYVMPDYLLITAGGANIRSLPDPSSARVGRVAHFEKVEVIALVRGKYVDFYKTDLWYEVSHTVGDLTVHGYILATLAELRTFQFQKMADAFTALKSEVDSTLTAYISNYKNRSGVAPLHLGSTFDAYGVKRYQSAPAYFSASTAADFRYIPDGNLVTILAETGVFYKIRTLNFPGEYYIPKRYVSLRNSIDQLTKVIVVDRKNQNEAVFEYSGGHWFMISFIYATTGELAQYKEPTDLGYYTAIEKANNFLYLDDITKKVAGYAPYVIRFGGGAYIHGVPIDVPKSKMVYNRLLYFPPMREYSATIGTVPRSHKCVRNYTSHAKFLWDWSEIGKTAVIVIE